MDTHITPPAPNPPRVMAEAPVDLPPATLSRWSAERKAEVVRALRAGAISAEQACARWSLSPEEVERWVALYDLDGLNGLRTTQVWKYRR